MESYWHKTARCGEFPALEGDRETEVAILGGGMAGVLTAYLLKERGVDALILEADRVGSGTTGSTTGKITAQHGLIYATLLSDFGKEKAREYAKANMQAVEQYKTIVEAGRIDCGFETADSYVYSRNGTAALKAETEAMKRLSLDAEYLARAEELPFETTGAVRLKNQARFHPLKFLYALAGGLNIMEKTRVLDVKDDVAFTARGKVRFRHVVFACRYPIINIPGYYFLRMSQQRSYLVALKNAAAMKGMYLDANDGGLTLRPEGDVLLFGGFDIRSGKNPTGGKYTGLLQRARSFYPECELEAQWSAEDCRSIDNVPYIGRYSESTPNWYVATGFNKWGMTGAMAAANILVSAILEGKEGPSVFAPARFEVAASAKNLAGDVSETVAGLAKGIFSVPEETFSGVERGKAALAEFEGERVCVYRDDSGRTHILPSRCSHLGCRLEWNSDDLAWECPCHGSRFDVDGAILDGPTVKPMGQEENS